MTLSGQDDIFSSNLSTAKLVTVTTGAGADRVVMSAAAKNASFNVDGSIKTAEVVTDFTKGSDKLDLTALGTSKVVTALDATTLTAINAAPTIQAAVDAALHDTHAATGTALVFTYGADTYVAFQDATAGFNVGDGLVKLAGVTGLSVGTASASDILSA